MKGYLKNKTEQNKKQNKKEYEIQGISLYDFSAEIWWAALLRLLLYIFAALSFLIPLNNLVGLYF